jgi:hypothetical protein
MKNMKMMLSVLMIVAAVGCSVKEDRTVCPCVMSLDFSGLDTSVIQMVNVLAMSADGVVFSDCVMVDAFDDRYERKVPHGLLQVSLWCGDGGMAGKDCLLRIPYGVECPPVYLNSFVADTRAESYHRKVSLYKNHCRLTVEMPDRQALPYSLTFKGGVDGYDIDGSPSYGDFSCVAFPAQEGPTQVLLPRQTDSSLMLEVDDQAPHGKIFAIGEYLAAGGYDWSAENLADVTVVLDYSMTVISISMAEWDKEEEYKVIF